MTQGQGTAIFSPQDVVEIRRLWDDGSINVRKWADTYGCSPETVRKIGRRDTYRTVGVRAAPGASYGPAASRDSTPPAIGLPGQPFPKGDPEPTEEELAASASRLAARVADEKAADRMLDELGGKDV